MLKHIKRKHFVNNNFESSSRNPDDYQNNSKVSENESKNDGTSNVDEQINNSTTNDEDKNSGMGFFKDPILGELTCQTCQYQCYGSTKMLKHIKTNHLVISNFESSSRNPEEMVNVIGGMSSNDESEDYQNNSKVSENESKNDSTSNVDEQINNSTRNDEDKNSGMGFFKDPILGELTCQTCQYQCYGSTKMLKHIKTNHLVISNFESSSRNPEEMV